MDGNKDVISLLYNDSKDEQYETYPFADINGFSIFSNASNGKDIAGPTWTLKMLVTGYFTDTLSVSAGDLILTKQNFGSDLNYDLRTRVQGFINKMPYYAFSDYGTGF